LGHYRDIKRRKKVKVKNIAFSGFAAAILAAGVANAATVPQIASREYVDDKVKADVGTLQTTLENNYTTTEQLGTVINQNITEAITADDGALKTELGKKQDALTDAQMSAVDSGITADDVAQITTNKDAITALGSEKEDAANKKTSITDENKASTTDFPTIGAVVSYTNAEINKLSTDGLPVNPDNITDGTITGDKLQDGTIAADKLSTELQTEIANKADKITVTAEQKGNIATVDENGQYQVGDVKASDLATAASVSTAIADAVKDGGAVDAAVDTKIATELAEGGSINTALADKANAEDVYTKGEADTLFDARIPVPSDTCQADSGRCVLSVAKGSNGKTGLQWLDITQPLEETTPTNPGA